MWLLGDATCEKMGDLMAVNGGRLLGLYELSTFLTQLNLYRGKGLSLSLFFFSCLMGIHGLEQQV